ncbi:hypothetical protein LE181_08110 [Streptomyces sp. SCA3-4]|uniref:hypothetical protein n=1 Tax=Streptomyces sichuanensis TaxID=2871810 RepID=UPI001CE389CF|nr:hypothetical protein [Streptomyces sichuanensis]MCA6092123.1 hypothetical protein [Streptomyces sichuanensis]
MGDNIGSRTAGRVRGRAGWRPGDLRVPVGADAGRWRTFEGGRVLVAAARTVTSAVRLLDVLPALLRSDPRVDVVFAFDPTSAFDDGVHDLLRATGVRVMPWDQLPRIHCHLVVSASENIDLTAVAADCPVLVLPHGVGFHKLVPDARGEGRRLSGVMDDARAWHAVSHHDQTAQLAEHHPWLAARSRLVGDPYHDLMLASRPLRARYRAALGAGDGRRLVVVTSTWGPQSLLGTDPGLPARLVAGLPLDEYRVAAVVHPNVWFAHGRRQVRAVLAAALDGGLRLIPPERGWQAALVAADVVLGDHGSVTLYAAALGRPLLLAAFGEESVPGTPMAELGRIVPRLEPHGPLGPQLERAMAEHDAERVRKVTDGAFAEPGHALERLRATVYELLGLALPAAGSPPLYACPVPDAEGGEVTAAWVSTSVTGDDVTVRRLPATGGQPEEGDGTFCHLSCDEEERDLRLLGSASAIVSGAPGASAAAGVRWARQTLAAWPGSRLATAAVPGGCVTVLRDGRVVESTATGPLPDAALHAAVVYARLRARHALTGTAALHVAGRTEDVTLGVRPALHSPAGTTPQEPVTGPRA